MWYDTNTSRLARTVKYKIGYDSIDKMNVNLNPIKKIHKREFVKTYILGIPVSFKDEIIKYLDYSPSDDFNVEYKCPKASKFNSTDVIFNLIINFTEKQYIHHKYSIDDVFSTIGGLVSLIQLIGGYFALLYIFFFLNRISKYIKENMKIEFIKRCIPFMKCYK